MAISDSEKDNMVACSKGKRADSETRDNLSGVAKRSDLSQWIFELLEQKSGEGQYPPNITQTSSTTTVQLSPHTASVRQASQSNWENLDHRERVRLSELAQSLLRQTPSSVGAHALRSEGLARVFEGCQSRVLLFYLQVSLYKRKQKRGEMSIEEMHKYLDDCTRHWSTIKPEAKQWYFNEVNRKDTIALGREHAIESGYDDAKEWPNWRIQNYIKSLDLISHHDIRTIQSESMCVPELNEDFKKAIIHGIRSTKFTETGVEYKETQATKNP